MAVEVCTVVGYGELRKESGHGTIRTFVPPERGKRNAKVEITAEHLSDPVSGWVDTHEDKATYAAANAAFEAGQRIYYTVYTCRLPDVDDSIPFAQLDKKQKRRLVVEIIPVNGAGIPLDDRSQPQPQPQPEPQPERQAEPPAAADAPSPPEQPSPPEPAPPDAGRPARRGPRVAEGRPWEPHNSDGSLNLGSFAVVATESMVLHAYELMREEGIEPTAGPLKSLARHMLEVCDRVQAAHREDRRSDRMVNSHTRARAAVREALRRHPVPFGQGSDREAVAKWKDSLVEEASMILTTVLELIDREVP